MTPPNSESQSLGPNAWLVEELAGNFQENPKSVPEEWREVFNGAESGAAAAQPAPPAPKSAAPTPISAAPTAAPAPAPAASTAPEPSAALPAAPAPDEPGTQLRGVAARIVTNMEASLGVPTATSFREVPAKLLEINRRVVNNHLGRIRGGKVSFTHLIGYAIVRAVTETVPAMNNVYVEGADGKPRLVQGCRCQSGHRGRPGKV